MTMGLGGGGGFSGIVGSDMNCSFYFSMDETCASKHAFGAC